MKKNNYSKHIIGLLGVAILILFCIYFSEIVWWLLIAGFISAISSPIVNLLGKIHIRKFQLPRWIAAAITVVFIWFLLASFVYLTIPFIAKQVNQFQNIDVQSLQNGFREPISKVDEFVQSYPILDLPDFSVEEAIIGKVSSVINFSVARDLVANIGNTAFNLFMALFSITFFTYFFLKEAGLFHESLMSIVPRRYEEQATRILAKLPRLIKRYLHGIFFEMLSIFVLITIGLLICGQSLGLSLLIGIICGFLNIIPYIGPWIGAAIGIIFIGAANINVDFYDTTMPQIWGLLITVVVVRLLDDFIFQPFFYSRSVNAHPLEIFIIIIIAGSLYGILGMILAIPVYTVIRVIAKEFLSEYKFVQKITQNIEDGEDKS
ncbi:MAG: AI-2E family transporter [Bacteroidales bacterium]|nr:AI-2E family transporter [Bacteroidales bacterium]